MKGSGIRPLGYTDPRGYEYAVVDIDLLVPDVENPRIPIQESTLDTLLALVEEDADGLYALAKDIVLMQGTSPSELFNVTRRSAQFVVKEGNRRIAARRLLRNPEQLKGHVSKAELDRWKRLSTEARSLPDDVVVVIGDDHESWIDRRHLGPQGGIGVQQWRPQAKARRAERTRGTKDRTLSLLDGLKATYPDRFDNLDPPIRTFTTFERVIESSVASAHIGVDVNENGSVQLRYGERSVKLLEEVLRDLRKTGSEKLTSRKIHDLGDINTYMDELDARLGSNLDTSPLTLDATTASRNARTAKKSASRARPRDVLADYDRTAATRPAKVIEELKKVRRQDLPNAAIILTRVLFELSADHYATEESLSFAGDRNAEMEEEVKDFRKQLGVAGIRPSASISRALTFVATRPLSLGTKLELVIKDLMNKGRLDHKEGAAKIRELKEKTVIELLNDAVHRLNNVPSVSRVDHILEVMKPVYNAMVAE
jgi:hypothetical protein